MMLSPDIAIIVQARMGSTRLPKKSLMELAGRPLLQHLVDSLLQITPKDQLWIATSTNSEDDEIEEFCKKEELQCFRGHPTNVAQRFVEFLTSHPIKYFARINGDSPLFDFRVLEEASTALILNSGADLISTAVDRSYPSGTNVEIVKTEAFLQTFPLFSKPDHFEHVTKYFYENPSRFSIHGLTFQSHAQDLPKLSVDTEKEFHQMNRLFHELRKPHFNYTLREKLKLAETSLRS